MPRTRWTLLSTAPTGLLLVTLECCHCALIAPRAAGGVKSATSSADAPEKPNVLFIVIDDLRPQLSYAYNQTETITPSMDKLAKESLVFNRAYCQLAVCAPSRNSFMTGMRPDSVKAWNFIDHFREPGIGPNWISLPEYFKKNGYVTLGGGKTFHPNLPPNYDEPLSWTQEMEYLPLKSEGCPGGETYCPLASPDEDFFDNHLANNTIEIMKLAKKAGKPFFAGAGFRRPHLPWRFPERFFSMYPDSKAFSTAKHQTAPTGMPLIAFTRTAFTSVKIDGKKYSGWGPETPFPEDVQQKLRHGYYSAVSWVDSQVGRVLDTLEELDMANNTVVVLFADHGWQLGEHGEWCKHTNFELSARVPLIFRVPWKPSSMGTKTNGFAELVDLYPTLAELAGLPDPTNLTHGQYLEGSSLASYFEEPDQKSVKDSAYSQYPRCPKNISEPWKQNSCHEVKRQNIYAMGLTVRTESWRYTEWLKWNGDTLKVEWDQLLGQELYSHSNDTGTDFDMHENANEANNTEYKDVVTTHHGLLYQKFFRP